MPRVTTRSEPPRPGPPPRRPPPANCQFAVETPCHVFSVDAPAARPNAKSRVCVPASVSTLSVVSFSQEMRMRPTLRMMLPAPYDRHCSPAAASRAGSQASAILRASALSGMLG
jgi:hypothetical protein